MADVNLEQPMEALRKENQSLRQEVARLRADNRRWARLVRGRANMLRAHTFPCGTSTAQITVSAGVVVVVPTDATDEKVITESVFHSLSEALYAAKAAGGNQVQVAQEIGLSSS